MNDQLARHLPATTQVASSLVCGDLHPVYIKWTADERATLREADKACKEENSTTTGMLWTSEELGLWTIHIERIHAWQKKAQADYKATGTYESLSVLDSVCLCEAAIVSGRERMRVRYALMDQG